MIRAPLLLPRRPALQGPSRISPEAARAYLRARRVSVGGAQGVPVRVGRSASPDVDPDSLPHGFADGWDPMAPAVPFRHPLPGAYPAYRRLPRDPAFEPGGGSPSASGAEGGSPAHRVAEILEHYMHPLGRTGGTYTFNYVPAQQPLFQYGAQGGVSQFVEVARLEGSLPQRCVIYTSYSQFGDLRGMLNTVQKNVSPRVVCQVILGGGSNGGTATALMRFPAGVPVAVTGTHVYVSVGLFTDEWGDLPIDPTQYSVANGVLEQLNVTAQVFISPGDPSLVAQPTAWFRPNLSVPNDGQTWEASGGITWNGPGRIKQITGYASAGNANAVNYLFLYDWPYVPLLPDIPAATIAPIISPIPIPSGDPFMLDNITSGLSVSMGLQWSLSSTSSSFTATTDKVSLSVERYCDLQVGGNDLPTPPA